jgi:hypothetical protein
MPPFDPNENRSLFPFGIKPSPTTVDVSAPLGQPMPNGMLSMKPIGPSVPTAAKELQRGDPSMSGKLHMARTKPAPTLPAGVSADQLRRGGDGPWSKGR